MFVGGISARALWVVDRSDLVAVMRLFWLGFSLWVLFRCCVSALVCILIPLIAWVSGIVFGCLVWLVGLVLLRV